MRACVHVSVTGKAEDDTCYPYSPGRRSLDKRGLCLTLHNGITLRLDGCIALHNMGYTPIKWSLSLQRVRISGARTLHQESIYSRSTVSLGPIVMVGIELVVVQFARRGDTLLFGMRIRSRRVGLERHRRSKDLSRLRYIPIKTFGEEGKRS